MDAPEGGPFGRRSCSAGPRPADQRRMRDEREKFRHKETPMPIRCPNHERRRNLAIAPTTFDEPASSPSVRYAEKQFLFVRFTVPSGDEASISGLMVLKELRFAERDDLQTFRTDVSRLWPNDLLVHPLLGGVRP